MSVLVQTPMCVAESSEALGFIAGKEVLAAGITNLGMRDRECAYRCMVS